MTNWARIMIGTCGITLASALTAAASLALTGPGTIRVTDKLVKEIHVDGGHPGRGAGDLEFYRGQLFNKGITPTAIGHSDITCTNTGTGSSNCTGTYFLPKGKIMVGGVIGSRLFFELAVVGGTGLYDNARGTMTVTRTARKPVRNMIVFRLVG